MGRGGARTDKIPANQNIGEVQHSYAFRYEERCGY